MDLGYIKPEICNIFSYLVNKRFKYTSIKSDCATCTSAFCIQHNYIKLSCMCRCRSSLLLTLDRWGLEPTADPLHISVAFCNLADCLATAELHQLTELHRRAAKVHFMVNLGDRVPRRVVCSVVCHFDSSSFSQASGRETSDDPLVNVRLGDTGMLQIGVTVFKFNRSFCVFAAMWSELSWERTSIRGSVSEGNDPSRTCYRCCKALNGCSVDSRCTTEKLKQKEKQTGIKLFCKSVEKCPNFELEHCVTEQTGNVDVI